MAMLNSQMVLVLLLLLLLLLLFSNMLNDFFNLIVLSNELWKLYPHPVPLHWLVDKSQSYT